MNFEDYETLPTNNVLVHMTAGAFAGVMEHCVMYPLDSVKTRMQSLLPATAREGVSDTFLRMVKHEGIFRPVKGMPAVILGAGPAHALYFSSYEYLKDKMLNYASSSAYHPLVYGLAGCISTILHDAIMNPAEVIKQRMQMYNSPYSSVSQCLRLVYKTEGARAFYRSYTTQLTMNIPFQSIHFIVYEVAQNITNKERKYNPGAHMLSGALAGAIAAAITTPLDVCKTLLNTQQVGQATGLVHAIKTVYRLGGAAGYFRGLKARVMFQMPSTAICWSTYEFFKYFFSQNKLVGSTSILAESEQNTKEELITQPPSSETITLLKPRELPAMSGAGLYGSISFNTMHTADTHFSNRRKEGGILDMRHT